jgi:hypothetical protein
VGKNSRKTKNDKADKTKKSKAKELKPANWYTNSPSVSADVGTRKTQ